MAPPARKPTKPFQRPRGLAETMARVQRDEATRLKAAKDAAAAAAANKRASAMVSSSGPKCPNKHCTNPKVVDGICHGCGRIAEESNIVAEVQFGETSSGAAMVQGSYISADQGGARTFGPGGRGAGSSQRDKTIIDAKNLIHGYVWRLAGNPRPHIVDKAVATFKLAMGQGFTQGRTLQMVCAACIYYAFRSQERVEGNERETQFVMMLDLADLTRLNVFRLGRCFKALVNKVPIGSLACTIFPEDIIHRLATKLDFGPQTDKVAEDAVRLITSMRRDWIIMGRRPSGICGACLLMAARMNNFRRTMREVVYIVKVTSHTIQERMKEFNETAASQLTIDDFLTKDWESAGPPSHDPPSFYRHSDEYKKRIEEKRRKRKRTTGDDGSDRDGSVLESPAPPPIRTGPDLSSVPCPSASYLRDKDGYLIPPVPPPEPTSAEDRVLNGQLDGEDESNFPALVDAFGDDKSKARGVAGNAKGRPPKHPLPINEEWVDDEENMEEQISEIMNDPETMQHAAAYASAEQRARLHADWALQYEPSKTVSMAPEVLEDEFADDVEVMNALLSPEEVKLKEIVWVNENQDWLRKNQQREFDRKLEAGKPKRPRKRNKPRLGEAQTSPASTPIEAAQNVMKHHGMSKRLNYDAISSLLNSGPGGGPGTATGTASGQTSQANSVLGDAFRDREIEPEEEEDDDDDEEAVGEGEGGGEGEEYGEEYDEDYNEYEENYDDEYDQPENDE
ncbi:transcription factor TFIIIB subunit brf1 [Verticillium nonalfalfae]|uniref:Transcription factor TFIIIB subunit brf1 n=1 Tax=Verticillium nonalfalfae TaxID=1051616 RepID=A0A3M9XZV8_9PEZI|nr:transcription factor TFIIIB subunit brf1 [Verticillium nonalfalfae]RNJ53541.1 transcription factor TFIIIB subunit brf1 [Verticillium nonalfalfae]